MFAQLFSFQVLRFKYILLDVVQQVQHRLSCIFFDVLGKFQGNISCYNDDDGVNELLNYLMVIQLLVAVFPDDAFYQ